MTKVDDVYWKRDLILVVSQSNALWSGDPITAWPPREREDRSSLWVNMNLALGAWSYVRTYDVISNRGTLIHSLCARMRDRGMRPAVIHYGSGGKRCADLGGGRATITG